MHSVSLEAVKVIAGEWVYGNGVVVIYSRVILIASSAAMGQKSR